MKPALQPVVWSPPPARPLPRATPLPELRRIALPACGEDVLVDLEGRLITGLADGRVLRLDLAQGVTETLADTGGRPLCIEHDRAGRLIVCDAELGLLRLDPETKRIEVLVDALTHRLGLCNNAAVAADGSIYFSDSSRRFPLEHWRGDLLEHSGTGRLLKRAPDGKVAVLLEHLHFANGVALAADESFVAVAETGTYRILRHWLSGARAGQTDVLIDRLPAFPDNIASDASGLIWVALASTRNWLLDVLHRSAPMFRRIVWAVPTRLQPQPSRQIGVLALDIEGRVVRHISGSSDAFHMVTGLRAHAGKLYLASLEEPALAVFSLMD